MDEYRVELPNAPEIHRRTRFNRTQALGMLVIGCIPVAATFGLLDTHQTTDRVTADDLRLEVEYPSRLRDRTFDPMRVTVVNESPRIIPEIEVRFGREYFKGLDRLEFQPSADEQSEAAYVVCLKDVQPAERRSVSVSYEAEQFGRHDGAIEAHTKEGKGPRIEISTFAFP